MGLIALTGMEFYAHHGCYKEEQVTGNNFIVDLEFSTATELAETEDDLAKTINYQQVYEIVKVEMQIKSKLLEHVARRILDALFKRFLYLGNAKVVVSKLNPPLGGKMEKVSVILTRSR